MLISREIRHFRLYSFKGEDTVALGQAYLWRDMRTGDGGHSVVNKEVHLEPRGGATLVMAFDLESGRTYSGISVCSSREPFCKKKGREIAYGRAVSAAKKGVRVQEPKQQEAICCLIHLLLQPENKGKLVPMGNIKI